MLIFNFVNISFFNRLTPAYILLPPILIFKLLKVNCVGVDGLTDTEKLSVSSSGCPTSKIYLHNGKALVISWPLLEISILVIFSVI